MSYLPATSELTIEFEIPAPIADDSYSMGVDQDYGTLAGIDVSGTASASGEVTLSGIFGVDLTELKEDLTPDDVTDDDSWANHFYLHDLRLDANVTVATEDASASARLGIIEVGIADASLTAQADAFLEFSDPDSPDGKINFKRLSEAAVSDPTALVGDSDLSGSASIALTEMTVDGIPGLELDGGEINIGFSDLADLDSFTFDINEPLRNINSLRRCRSRIGWNWPAT